MRVSLGTSPLSMKGDNMSIKEEGKTVCAVHNAESLNRDKHTSPALVKRIGKITYVVKIHFSETSHETMSDKIKRMLRNEASKM
mgnify:CR=1 FL=1